MDKNMTTAARAALTEYDRAHIARAVTVDIVARFRIIALIVGLALALYYIPYVVGVVFVMGVVMWWLTIILEWLRDEPGTVSRGVEFVRGACIVAAIAGVCFGVSYIASLMPGSAPVAAVSVQPTPAPTNLATLSDAQLKAVLAERCRVTEQPKEQAECRAAGYSTPAAPGPAAPTPVAHTSAAPAPVPGYCHDPNGFLVTCRP